MVQLPIGELTGNGENTHRASIYTHSENCKTTPDGRFSLRGTNATCIFFTYIQVHSVSSKVAAERARITLKSLETLTYSCTDANVLLELEQHLQSLVQDLRLQLPQEEGLVIRPAVVSRAMKTKRKYAHIRDRQQTGYCSALTEGKRVGEREQIRSFETE